MDNNIIIFEKNNDEGKIETNSPLQRNSPPFLDKPFDEQEVTNNSYKILLEDNEKLIHKVASLQQLKFALKEKITGLIEKLENKSRLIESNLFKLSGSQVTKSKSRSIDSLNQIEVILEDTLFKNIQLQVRKTKFFIILFSYFFFCLQ